MFVACLLGSFFTLVESGSLPPYQLWNFTWVIYNQAGDVANSTSNIATSPSWSPLEVDLCKLALGAHPSWGAPNIFLPQSKAPELDSKQPYIPGCGCFTQRFTLRTYRHGFYVCPGGHRNHAQDYKCGFSTDFFCASWGCETTGQASWNPSSSWDYIIVKRKIETSAPSIETCQASNLATQGWCNPLNITFTDKAKAQDWVS